MILTWNKAGYGKYELTELGSSEVLGTITVQRNGLEFTYVARCKGKTSTLLKAFGDAKAWVELELEGVTRAPQVGSIREDEECR